MDKYIFDESNGLWYELQSDYYIPCLILSEEEPQPIGLWGQRHKQYLKEHKRFLYTTMLIKGILNSYLADIDRQATEMMFRLVEQMADKEGLTEQFKAENPMLWVGKMNAVRSTAILKDQRLLFNTFIQKQYVETLCFSKVPFTVFKRQF